VPHTTQTKRKTNTAFPVERATLGANLRGCDEHVHFGSDRASSYIKNQGLSTDFQSRICMLNGMQRIRGVNQASDAIRLNHRRLVRENHHNRNRLARERARGCATMRAPRSAAARKVAAEAPKQASVPSKFDMLEHRLG
jgi:hypothetical protein